MLDRRDADLVRGDQRVPQGEVLRAEGAHRNRADQQHCREHGKDLGQHQANSRSFVLSAYMAATHSP